MNLRQIKLHTGTREIIVPNRWDLLSPEVYLFVVALLSEYSSGNASIDDVRYHYVCRSLNLDPAKITDPDAISNLIVIADQVDFIFDESGKLNGSFLAQLVPDIKIKKKKYTGYTVNTAFDTLTCSLTAAQFIDATGLMKDRSSKLPLLASILYSPLPYSSERAHEMAAEFEVLPPVLLKAISLNFQSVFTYLFTETQFSLLATKNKEDVPEISTGMLETMYNLSVDGMGDVKTTKQMPVIEFLTILRKKLIESVRAMHDAKVDMVKIIKATGLNSKIIKKML